MNQLRVKNHFVPECYLKRWINSNNKIWVYKTLVSYKAVPAWRNYSPAAIAYHKHLYTRIISGSETDEIEKWLDNEFESPANEVLEKVVSDQRLSSDDWQILIRFLAAQDVRTPARLLEHLKRATKELPEVLKGTLGNLKETLGKGNVSLLDQKEKSKIGSKYMPLKITTVFKEGSDVCTLKAESYVGRSTWIFSIKHLLENTEKVLHTHKWTIVKPAQGYYWFTSDNPVIKLNYTNPNNYDLRGGWGKNKGNIIFPIAPEHAMYVQIGDRPPLKGSRMSIAQTKEIRKIIAENSYRMILSDKKDSEILVFRKRIVDSEILNNEVKAMQDWHNKNSILEREYFTKIKDA